MRKIPATNSYPKKDGKAWAQKAQTESHPAGKNLKLLLIHPRSELQRIYLYRYYPDMPEVG